MKSCGSSMSTLKNMMWKLGNDLTTCKLTLTLHHKPSIILLTLLFLTVHQQHVAKPRPVVY